VPPLHLIIPRYLGYELAAKPQRAKLMRGAAAAEQNKAGAEALMAFMDGARHLFAPGVH
jgi:hypothetical protein